MSIEKGFPKSKQVRFRHWLELDDSKMSVRDMKGVTLESELLLK